MTAFDSTDHPYMFLPAGSSPDALGMQDLNGLLKVHLKNKLALHSPLNVFADICFTAIDQAFVIWGVITFAIFCFAQFSMLDWRIQAVIDSALTGVGVLTTSGITWKIANEEKLRWVIFLWAGLMGSGVIATTYGIFYSVVPILSNLCLLWLGLCAVGYGIMAVGMQSRCFTAACLVHGLAIAGLDYQTGWQFLASGFVMAFTLFFFSVVPWDMQASEFDNPC